MHRNMSEETITIRRKEYEECSHGGHDLTTHDEYGYLYFKKVKSKPKFPIKFDLDYGDELEITENGNIRILKNGSFQYCLFPKQFDKFKQAIKKAKEIRDKCQ